jgi:outer membrane receptor protein involved in Fe transport
MHTAVTVGGMYGDLLARLTWSRTGEFEITPAAGDAFQSKVDAFDTVNLAFQYAPKASGLLQNTTYSLNIDNLFDTDPPVERGNTSCGYGYAGITLGRFIEVGIKKKF